MAKRLTVVLSQSRYGSSAQRACEEELVPLLLLERNIDVAVIPHLEDIRLGDTGHLCLEGITGPFVFVSWLPTQQAHALLNRSGIRGRVGRTVFQPDVAADSNDRPIYFLPLSDGVPIDQIVAEIRRIRDDLLVPAVPIISLLSLGESAGRQTTGGSAHVPNSTSQAQPALKPSIGSAETERPTDMLMPTDVQPPKSDGNHDEQPFDEDIHLDQLLNELDRFME